jgi:hypothetical protein
MEGVIALLVRTSRQGEFLREYEKRIARLERELGSLAAGLNPSPPSPADAPAPPAPDAEPPEPEAAAVQVEAAERPPSALQNSLAAFIHGGNLWGILILAVIVLSSLALYIAKSMKKENE